MEDAVKRGLQAGFRLNLWDGKPASEEAPLVVVLGWYGALDKHVSKYTALLNQQGYATVRAIMPPPAVFFPFNLPRRRFAARLLDFVDSVLPLLGDPRVAFYVFSNGGGFALEQVDHLVHSDNRYHHLADRIAGTIFDSAPAYMHLSAGKAAISSGLGFVGRLLAIATFYAAMLVMIVVAPGRQGHYWRNMTNLRLGSRTLYLYSADDKLADAVKLDELIAARRRQLGAAQISAVRWEHSPHVAHLRQHPQEYSEALFSFLQSLHGRN